MYPQDTLDRVLTVAGVVALGALVALLMVKSQGHLISESTAVSVGRSFHQHHHVIAVGGPMNVDGPMHVQGNLYVGGPATVHGHVQANTVAVGGPIATSLPKGEPPGPSGQTFAKSVAIGGPLTVQGPLVVDGKLVVGGPLRSEPAE